MDDVRGHSIENGIDSLVIRVIGPEAIDLSSEIPEGVISEMVSKEKVVFLENASVEVDNGHKSESCTLVSEIGLMIPMENVFVLDERYLEPVFCVAVFGNMA